MVDDRNGLGQHGAKCRGMQALYSRHVGLPVFMWPMPLKEQALGLAVLLFGPFRPPFLKPAVTMVPFHAAQVIPLEDQGLGLGEAFNMRLDELKVVDIAFLGELPFP